MRYLAFVVIIAAGIVLLVRDETPKSGFATAMETDNISVDVLPTR